jgi:hypothetical protein
MRTNTFNLVDQALAPQKATGTFQQHRSTRENNQGLGASSLSSSLHVGRLGPPSDMKHCWGWATMPHPYPACQEIGPLLLQHTDHRPVSQEHPDLSSAQLHPSASSQHHCSAGTTNSNSAWHAPSPGPCDAHPRLHHKKVEQHHHRGERHAGVARCAAPPSPHLQNCCA